MTPCLSSSAVPVRWDPALAALATLVFLAVIGLGFLPFVSVAPNRLVPGEPVMFAALLHSAQASIAASLAVGTMLLALFAVLRPTPLRSWAAAVVAAAMVPGWLWLASAQALDAASGLSAVARVSLGGGFWLAVALSGLAAADGLQRLSASWLARSAVALLVLLPLCWLLASGQADGLSLMKEYANRSDALAAAVWRHLQIVGIALACMLAIGLPLGWAAHRFARVGSALFPVLNIVQTIPSIALFGLLMAPLAWLAASVPAVGRAGIGGVGMAPGIMALTLYGLLPVVRGTVAGLAQVPAGALQAATGLGMTASQVFARVQLPLALPVVLAGVRTAAIQSVGLAAVTALIGAGGLGSLMFEGLFSNAQDLVLLGVLPIVALGALVDGLFRAFAACLETGAPAMEEAS